LVPTIILYKVNEKGAFLIFKQFCFKNDSHFIFFAKFLYIFAIFAKNRL
jgi:hypothetical protein